jgi:aryl-alcohol dehydrogenase-like predicted oxidoreductase
MIDRIRLGRSELDVPRICLGTMTFGEQNSESGAHSQLDYALERGINFIDTAEMYPLPSQARTYGQTERIVGTWLRGKPRDRVIVATKVAGPGRGMDWMRKGDRSTVPELSRRDIVLACEASLARLQTDHIDLYQIHWPARNVPLFGSNRFELAAERVSVGIQEQLEAMAQLIDEGKIRHVGVSNETAWGVCEFTRVADQYGLPYIASTQNIYNLMSREFEQGLTEACLRERVGLLAYSALAFGYLTGKYADGAHPPKARMTLFGARWPRYNKPKIIPVVSEYAAIARQFDWTPLQLALAFVYSRPFVTSTIIGATSIEQLRQCIDAYELKLTSEMLAAIEAVHEYLPNPAP